MLKAGGNAADAACATALALGVINPFASGLGGGGFAVVHLATAGEDTVLDFRETAPAHLRPQRQSSVIPKQSGLSVGVPSEPRGLAELVRRFGVLPFSRCIDPALRLARGFAVTPWLAAQLREEIERDPATGPDLVARLFGVDRQKAAAFEVGDRVARPALAKTLELLRRQGVDAYYQGDVAQAIVDAVTTAGGVLTLDDLSGYAPVVRAPLVRDFLGRQVITVPPPSAGGTIIAEALGILADRVDAMRQAGPESADSLHLVAEALKNGFADRARFLGDPAFALLPMKHLLDPDYHRQLGARIKLEHVLVHDAYGTPSPTPPAPARDAGTANISVIDKAGNAVALTTTINLAFGSRIVAGDTGILLNDEMDDFTAPQGEQDVFAIAGSTANFPAPGKRPLSSMAPVIVVGKRGVELVAGAAGGPRIASTTLQILLDVLVFGLDARQAITAPRIHHQWEPDVLVYESALPAQTVRALVGKGHHCQSAPDLAKANAIVREPKGLFAAADPRSGGMAAGY